MTEEKKDRAYMGMGVFSPGSDASPGTTIVGGQPDGQRREGVQSVPVGLEQVLFAAATDRDFREDLLASRASAVERRGFALVDSERAVLSAAPSGQLERMIDRLDTSKDNLERREFMRAVAATMVSLAAGTALSACANAEDPLPASGGPPFKGPASQVVESPAPAVEPASMATAGGARPDLPEPGRIDASVEKESQAVKVEPPPLNVKGGARPDLPEEEYKKPGYKPTKIPIKPEKRPTRGHTKY